MDEENTTSQGGNESSMFSFNTCKKAMYSIASSSLARIRIN